MSMKTITRSNWILLSKKEAQCIFVYYLILFILSLVAAGITFWFYTDIIENIQVSKLIVICAVPCSLLGASIYYIRKLYKACIQNTVSEPTSTDFESYIRVIGAKVYFYIRPFVSVALALIISFGIYFGIFTLTVRPEIVQGNFAVLCMILSFYVGFNNGLIVKNKLLHKNNNMTQKEYDTMVNFVLLDRWRKNIDLVYTFVASPEKSIQREYANLLVTKSEVGSIMNPEVLNDYLNALTDTQDEFGMKFRNLKTIDTSEKTQNQVGFEVTKGVLETLYNNMLMEQVGCFKMDAVKPQNGVCTDIDI